MRRTGAIAVAVAGLAAIVLAGLSFAAPVLNPFTQAELDNNWGPDRQPPSDGVTSVSAFGRDDVARIGIDSTATFTDPNDPDNVFRRTEGIKTEPRAQNFGTSVNVDLYLDPDWQDQAVRAGFWVVGADGEDNEGRDNLFAIIEFVNSELCPEPDCDVAITTDHEGWRYWDSTIGDWTELITPFQYGTWVTLQIVLDTDAQLYRYSIDGVEVATALGGEHFIRELFLNSYNYGEDSFPNLSSDSYAAHWHAGLFPTPADKDDCKKGGWEDLTRADGTPFNNQGDCIQYVNTGS